MSSVNKLKLLGQSVWYDNVQRSLIENGTLKTWIERREILGLTSNPTIFKAAITSGKDYDADLQTMSWAGLSSRDMFYKLAIQDIQNVADLLRPYFDATGGLDGLVCLEVDPFLAYDTEATIDEAKWLWKVVNRPNLMVKIPGTKEGLAAITEVISEGINVNVTLIFSQKRYAEVIDAYMKGLDIRLAKGEDISQISSVASFFVSRLESKADGRLKALIDAGGEMGEKARALKGRIAVANTRLAYRLFEKNFSSDRFKKLENAGAQKQRPLWASTGTKDPDYSDIKYVEELVAENSINTLPPKTLVAFLDHGDPRVTIHDGLDQAEKDLEALANLGISLNEITQELEDEGVQSFMDSFKELTASIEKRRKAFRKELGSLKDSVAAQSKLSKANDLVCRMYRNDPTIWTDMPDGKAEIQKRLGWLRLPSQSKALIPGLKKFAQECWADGLEKVLLLGMGGSSLAPETMYSVLGKDQDGMELVILDATVPEQVQAAEKWVDYKKTLFIVASKSGTTTETISALDYFWEKSAKVLGQKRGSHFIGITDPGSYLVELGEEMGFRKVFTADPNVGGRYSALTHFGLVPAALMGIDLEKFLARAVEAAQKCSYQTDFERNTGAMLGVLLGVGEAEGKDKLTFITDANFVSLGAWLEQLVAESSGKEGRGIVPVADEPLMRANAYGSDRLFVYLRNSGEHDSFVEELGKAGHTNIVLSLKDGYSLAEQFYLWEFVVAIACGVMGVNAFNQPDVQDNKDRTKAKIADYKKSKKLEEPPVIWEANGYRVYGKTFEGLESCSTVNDVINAFLKLSQDEDYIALNAYVPRNDETLSQLTNLRKKVLEKTNRATTLGFGPRFLHSTGQLHKGGQNNGLFLQITQDDQYDVEIPGKGYGFSVLARAQAQGDLEALLARDRRAIRIHLPVEKSLEFEL